ncbi:single-stranded DNA-binding protein [Spirochaetia bacterium]|nr:single-stranded DNA-binding protein [Spirochaetia bacterium]
MVYEFEGRTEKEAIDRASAELGLGTTEFDVEILENQRSGLFRKGYVKIQVHVNKNDPEPFAAALVEAAKRQNLPVPDVKTDFENNMVSFLENIISYMGYPGTVTVSFREHSKIGFQLDSEFSSALIGKGGKTLDALQLLANIYAGRQGHEHTRIVLDSENYRIHREESLVRLAYSTADRVRERRASVLLEPMNPFDRRLIHTTLNSVSGVETKSEGEGFYRQVRVYYQK